ncbi:hypothetical protein Noda2021_02070 [Candidatus Dependentiae bacterium Noda2021]|nr:hypothetical protein Noda2021_02070 [Candidatus Dependentiae bacterium Noda2021]
MPLLIEIKAVPQSGRHKWVLDKSGKLKVYLKNPAQDYKANHEIIKSLAQAMRIPMTHIQIVSGAEGRNKRIRIEAEITLSHLLTALGIDNQQTIFKE